jgi:hypothetical protein
MGFMLQPSSIPRFRERPKEGGRERLWGWYPSFRNMDLTTRVPKVIRSLVLVLVLDRVLVLTTEGEGCNEVVE